MLNHKFWEKYFKVYDCLNLLIPYQETTSAIIDNLEIKKEDKILDLGSGTGNIAVTIEKTGAKVVGIDSSEEGMRRHQTKSSSAEIILGDITQKLPFEDCFFDKVYSNNVIYTISESKRNKLFHELKRILKDGGIIVISNPITNFRPLSIYWNHFKKQARDIGVLSTILKAINLIIPTIKMFYYNSLIKKAHKSKGCKFMDKNSQRNYLKNAGFKNISDNLTVYANQAILNKAYK